MLSGRLEDVSFSVQPGEVVGIIGRNGAGKITLLKILSRITEPTSGRVRIRGRVASLLEVGTGFHPELTGRENIFLNGAILGMTQGGDQRASSMRSSPSPRSRRFSIRRSSATAAGMYVRLAFAVAAHLEPEILIVDEVLAVGDHEFQKKCLGKMRSASTESGRTVLFVSHNMTAVASLCGRALLMDRGRICSIGAANEIIDAYTSPVSKRLHEQAWNDFPAAPGDDRVRVSRLAIETERGEPLDWIEMGSPFSISIDYWNLIEGANLFVEVIFRTADGTPIFHSFSLEDGAVDGGPLMQGLYSAICHVPGDLLNAGIYRIEINFQHGSMSRFFSLPDMLMIDVQDTMPRQRLPFHGRYLGTVHPILRWRHVGPADSQFARSSSAEGRVACRPTAGRAQAVRGAGSYDRPYGKLQADFIFHVSR